MLKIGLSLGIVSAGFVGAFACSSTSDDGTAGAGGAALVSTSGGAPSSGGFTNAATGATGPGGGATPSVPGGGARPSGTGGSTFPGITGNGGAITPPTGTGGVIGGGGTTGSGGITGVGGITGSGGITGTGGATGGATSAGGTTSVGGATSAGGATSGGGSTGTGGSTGSIPHGPCLDGITDFTKDGPFMMTTKTVGLVNFYVPSVPQGCKVPIVHLSNGTGATCSVYLPALQRLATHGFLTACYESANTGDGSEGMAALDAAIMNFPDLADTKFGSTGHSQGGQASFTVLALAEQKYGTKFIYAGLAMEPASGFGLQPAGTTWQALYATIKSPMFMFSGLGTDGLVAQTWVQSAYDALSKTEEAYFWTAAGATHIPVPNGEEEEISIPWFRWKLLGDQKACQAFKNIPKTNMKWAVVAQKNEQPCGM